MKGFLVVFVAAVLGSMTPLYGQMGGPGKSIYLQNGEVFTKSFQRIRVKSFTAHFDVEDPDEAGDWNIHAHVLFWGATLDGLVPDGDNKYTDPRNRAQFVGSTSEMGAYSLLDENWQENVADWNYFEPLQKVPGLPGGMDTRSTARGKSIDYASAAACPDNFYVKMFYDEKDPDWGEEERSSEILELSKPGADSIEIVDHKCGEDTENGDDIMDVYWKVSHIPGAAVPKVQIKIKDSDGFPTYPNGATWNDWANPYTVDDPSPMQGERNYVRGYADNYYVIQRGIIGDRPAEDTDPDTEKETYIVRADVIDPDNNNAVLMSSAEVTIDCTTGSSTGM